MDLETRKKELFYISEQAWSIIKTGFGNVQSSEQKSKGDFVTDVDLRAEKKILDYLSEKFPNDSLITEESDNKSGNSDFTWIVDPLDGTNNFLRGIPLCGVQIALLKDGKPVFGLLANLIDDVVYFAERGKGAFITDFKFNKQIPIKVSNRPLNESMVIISSNIAQDISNTQKSIIDSVFPSAASCRVFGVAVHEFPYIARGNIEAVVSNHPKAMDITAGSLLIEEAGGKVTTYDGLAWFPEMKTIVASNGLIHDELLTLIEKGLKNLKP